MRLQRSVIAECERKASAMRENYFVFIALVTASAVFTIANADDVEIPTKCPDKDHSGNTTVRLRHEMYCNKYYECVEGEAILKECPSYNKKGDKLHFNLKRQVCDWPFLVDCMNSNLDQAARVCPKNWRRCIRTPHEDDCAKFYLCDYDRVKLMTCAKGLHFNLLTQMCDFAKNVLCEPSCKWTCCPKDGCGQVRLPHECSCKKYYECDYGEQVWKICKDGERFDKWMMQCRPAKDVDCDLNEEKMLNEAIPKCPKDNSKVAMIAHESECNKYYECSGGRMILRKCLTDHFFNPSLGVCDVPENISCDVSRCCSPQAFKVKEAIPSDEAHIGMLPSEKEPDYYKN